MIKNIYETFDDAFYFINKRVLNYPQFIEDSRIGPVHEVMNLTFEINDPSTYILKNKEINRIDYKYASDFFDFMISGSTDAITAFEKYPNVAQFITKPKNTVLPSNFNAFYGPRIAKQLPGLIKELKDHPSTRRACIMILDDDDQVLLDIEDNKLEYPCTIALTFFIRSGKLNLQTTMRSQNTAVVMQLDFYLMGRTLETVAKMLELPVGKYYHNIINAHIYDRDFAYIENILENS